MAVPSQDIGNGHALHFPVDSDALLWGIHLAPHITLFPLALYTQGCLLTVLG